MYKYKIKGKELTFDTSNLDEKDKLKWDKLGKIGKLRMIESYNLTDSSGVPGDYIDVKTVKDKPQNERLAKLRTEEQKKNTLDNVKNRMNLTKDDTIDTVENVMLDEEKTLLNDDISKLKKDKENATLGDLEQIFINKIEQLTANEIGTINAKNIDTINASSVNKLLFDVKKLTDDLVNPLRPVLENLIERHGDDRHVLELADRNDIQGLIDELRRLKDESGVDEIKANIEALKLQLDLLTGVDTDVATIYGMVNENSVKLNEMLDKIKNESNPIKRMDEIKILTATDDQFNELKTMIEKIMNEKLSKDNVKEIINDKDLFDDLKTELIDKFGEKAQTIVDKIEQLKDNETIKYTKTTVDEIKNILKTNPEHKDITADEIKKMLETNKDELSKQFDESFNKTFDVFKKDILKSPKLSEDKNDILKGIFKDLANKYPDEFVNIAKGELSDDKFKDILNQTYNRMKGTLIESLKYLRQNVNVDSVVGMSNGDTREGYTKYKPYILFDDGWEKKLIDAINEGYDLKILPSNKEVSSSQLRSKYKGYNDLIDMLQDFVILNPSVKTVSGSIFSKIKDRITNKKGYDDLKDEVNNLKSEVNKLKQELETIKKAKAPEPPKQEIPKAPEPPKNNFLNDIIKRKDLKHVEQIKNDYTPDEGIVGDLKDIMKRRREDIEPDEYSEDEDIDWAAGIRKPKIMSYKDFLKVYNLY